MRLKSVIYAGAEYMFLLAALFFQILSSWETGKSLKLLWLPPLMALWVNLHGSFILGAVFMGGLLVEQTGAVAYTRLSRRDTSTQWPVFPAVLFMLVIIAMLLNPFGVDLLRWVVQDFILKHIDRIIAVEEHAPLKWGEHRLFWGLMLATGISFLLAVKGRFFSLFMFGATSFLALKGVRFVALATLIQVPILAENLHAMLKKIPETTFRPSLRLQAIAVIPLLIAGSVGLFHWSFTESKSYRFGFGIHENFFPEAAINFLRQFEPAGNIYNSWAFGGYLLWQLPERKVFWDGRFLDAQSELMEQFQTTPPMEFTALFKRLNVRSAILDPKDDLFITYFSYSDTFRLVYFDDRALIFLGQSAVSSEKDRAIGFFTLLKPESYDFSYLAAYARSADASRAEEELRRAVSLAPHSFKTHFFLGFFLEARAAWPEALEAYLGAAHANPRLAFEHYDLGRRIGRLALHVQEKNQAIRLLRDALHLNNDGELHFLLGTNLYQSGRLEEAEEQYLAVLKQEPRQVSCLVNLGYLYLDAGRFQEAEQMQRRTLQVGPGNEQALFGLALALQNGEKTAEAVQCWQEFLKKHPQSQWREKAATHLSQIQR